MDILDPQQSPANGRRQAGPEAPQRVCWTDTLTALSDPSLDPLFWRAERLGSPSAWWQHVPFAHWIVCATAPRVLVELGTHAGVSYAAFCQAVVRAQLATRCHAVDTWRGDPQAGFYNDEVLDELRRFHDERFGAFSTLLQCTFDEALDHIDDDSVDLLHIDGMHTYEAVRHDFESWLPKLTDKAVVLFHDINERSGDFGVWRLWGELSRRYPAFEFVHGHGLGVLAVGGDAPAPVAALCELRAPVAIAMIRRRFARLGEHWWVETRQRLLQQDAGQHIAAASAEAELLRAEAARHSSEAARQRNEADELRAALARHSSEAGAARAAAEQAWDGFRAASARASQAEQQNAALRTQAEEAEARARLIEAEKREATLKRAQAAESRLRFIEHSRAWRLARMLQQISGRLPLLRRAAKLGWWTCTLQLPRQLRVRRENIKTVAMVRQTGLFDDAYYRENTPDLVISGLDPALHFALYGWKEGRKSSPGFDTAFYLQQNPDVAAAGVNPLLHFVEHGRAEGRRPTPSDRGEDSTFLPGGPLPAERTWPVTRQVPSVRYIVQAHCASWAPLPVFTDRRAPPTLTILTDSVDANHLFGGVGTALVVGVMAARSMGARLRLVTRHTAPDPAALGEILQAHRVSWGGATDFVHMPVGEARPLPLGDGDIVLTTSWWSTRAVLGSVNAARVLYLLQEDERMFYPYSDSRLRCAETLSEPDLRVLVNTRLLFDHLADGPDPLLRLRERGHWFEPAFPAFPRPERLGPRNGNQNFFFYARPNNDRNLYWRGLEVIDAAMRDGVLRPTEWNIHFVGRELADMELPGNVRPIVWAKLPWSKYAELVSQMDLGLCLMDTPHPSYPPLDLAASGAAVVTNTHGPKTSLERWSRNIIAAPPSVAALGEALRDGVWLARDTARRLANCAADHIPRDWEAELHPVLDRLLVAKS